MKDELFKKDSKKQFEFDESVVAVFDDMISRSVPFYDENLRLCVALLAKFAKKNSLLCDLGCSTATFLLEAFKKRPDLLLHGVDNSKPMLDNAKKRAKAYGANISFHHFNLSEFSFFKADVFIANYTIQFIRPLKRQDLVNKIYENLNEGGFFILSEKIIFEDSFLSKKMIELHQEHKLKNGYSSLEISNKREALENVLVPYSEKENLALLENAGFKRIESIFKWANFETFLAFKD